MSKSDARDKLQRIINKQTGHFGGGGRLMNDGSVTFAWFVLNPDNFRKRVLKELAIRLGLPNLTFQIIRRTIATLAQTMGTIQDLQGVFRHARLPTTGNVYMQVIPAGVGSTVNSISGDLRKSPQLLTLARHRSGGSRRAI